ncbi:hypothetical protein [Burkholderia sp. D-99]|uniref:hypothetical protein n=1 Tax=Burkholderia sp. D-99 TaxID=2717316 RepID=UPI0014221D29|nr:hypothetical protein [Burkholderia sp. D-99]NHV31130.1 hypothetical protein [Burkholderia sp. D-99]
MAFFASVAVAQTFPVHNLSVNGVATIATPLGVASGGTGSNTATGSGAVVLATSPTVSGSAKSPFTVNGLQSVNDSGRASSDNTPTINLSVSEALNYTASYATHYGLILNAHELKGATGDRIGIGAVQKCDATLAGKSCVGASGLSVAGGTSLGNYTGMNPKALIPAGLTGPAGAAVGMESDIETHSPVSIRNGLRIADENLAGGTITHGTIEDAAIAIVTDASAGTPGFKTGIQFGEATQGYPQYWPILAGGTLIEANNPNVPLKHGLDFSGATGGFTGNAIVLPAVTSGNDIAWGGGGHEGGSIGSVAAKSGGHISFTDAGISLNDAGGRVVMNVGGSTGADVTNRGYETQYSLTGFVYCNGSAGRCTASKSVNTPTITHTQQEFDKSYVVASPNNGETLHFTAGVETLIVDPASARTSLTITMPACNAGNDGLIARFSTTHNITGLTVNATNGSVANAPASMNAGSGKGYLCAGARTTWYPLY